ncbi:MAG TPA: ABC transporter substrate-binding protein [Egibacteraceae bacterium]|nr:ABC transporter substrate-binding protein [Egibacteraceae bacterium]
MKPQLLVFDRRTFLRGAASVVGAAALAACTTGRGGQGERGGGPDGPTIRIQGGQFGLPHPFSYIAAPGYWRMSFVFDTLLWADSTGERLPWLASSHELSDDGLVHTLELRETTWHDGTPFTASDVVFTFDYFGSQTLSPLAIAAPRSVAEVIERGERTVEIRLEQADLGFEKGVLGSVPILPEHVWSTIRDPQAASGEETFIGTGPYRLVARDDAQGRLAFEANDDFFLGPPYVRRIEMVAVDDELRAVQAGELDGGQSPVEGVRNDVIGPFREDAAYGVIEHETAFAFPLFWNMDRGGALADVEFRRACLMAIDREDIVQRLLTGNGTVGNPGFLPPGHPFHVEVDQYAYDPDAANKMLDAAGFPRTNPGGVREGPDGSPLSFTLYVHDTVPPALPELVVANLEQIGVELNHEIVDLVRLFGIKTQGTYDLLITLYPGPVGTTPNADPDILRPVYHSDPPNQLFAAAGYDNPELDALLDRQYTIQDQDEREEVVAEIQQIVARDLPLSILYYTTMFFVFREDVFDAWYYTDGGFGPGIPDAYNKHAFVTGNTTGLEIRPQD